MMFFALALLFFALWWFADKNLKGNFLPYLKWPALAIIAIFVIIDAFFFVETDRFLNVFECCASCNDTQYGTTECEQCCPSYVTQYPCGDIDANVTLGTLFSGDNDSLRLEDGDRLTLTSMAPDGYILSVNYTCDTPDELLFVGKSSLDGNFVQVYNGTDWETVYAFNATGTDIETAISLAAHQYGMPSYMVRVYSYDDMQGEASFDVLAVSDAKTIYAYCGYTPDTREIFTYHYLEYSIIPLIVGLLPYLGTLVGGALALQLLITYFGKYELWRGRK